MREEREERIPLMYKIHYRILLCIEFPISIHKHLC